MKLPPCLSLPLGPARQTIHTQSQPPRFCLLSWLLAPSAPHSSKLELRNYSLITQTGFWDDSGSLQYHPRSKAAVKEPEFWKWPCSSQDLVKSHWSGCRTRKGLVSWVSETLSWISTNKQVSESRPGNSFRGQRPSGSPSQVFSRGNGHDRASKQESTPISSLWGDLTSKSAGTFWVWFLWARN